MIILDGGRLTLAQVIAIADGAVVQLGPRGRAAATQAHELGVRIAGERTVYGRTTGVGANKDVAVAATEGIGHADRLLHSHATSAGALRDPRRVRATMAIRLNQLAVGGSGARVDILDALLTLLNSPITPPVREHGGVGTGDLGALATIALALPGVRWSADDALPFLSSNAATLADAALAAAELLELVRAGTAVAALTLIAVDGQPEAFSETVETITPYAGAREVCAVVRELMLPGRTPRRLQDPFALRCLPQVQGLALDAVGQVVALVLDGAASAAENPVIDRAREDLVHHGGFHAAYLASALDAAVLAVANAGAQSLRRIAMLLDAEMTGLAAFLGDGTPGASGAMGLEYAAASALGDLRALAAPASLQTVQLSRGVEDDASFASLAARQALDACAPYAAVLAAELVGATRAVQLRGPDLPVIAWSGLATGLEDGLESESAAGSLADRDLTPDLEAAAARLPALAALARPASSSS